MICVSCILHSYNVFINIITRVSYIRDTWSNPAKTSSIVNNNVYYIYGFIQYNKTI
jgi:hypothetical protein